MARSDNIYNKRNQAIIAKLNRRAIASFYCFSKEYISKHAKYEKHICLTHKKPYAILEGTPIFESPKFNAICLRIADDYPSDEEYDSVDDYLDQDDDVSNEDSDNNIDTIVKRDNNINKDSTFEITLEGPNPEDGEDDENVEFTDTKNEYKIENIEPSSATMIRPKKKLRNSSSIRSDEYMMKYDNMNTWTDIFL
jgi:hypothetical protein